MHIKMHVQHESTENKYVYTFLVLVMHIQHVNFSIHVYSCFYPTCIIHVGNIYVFIRYAYSIFQLLKVE